MSERNAAALSAADVSLYGRPLSQLRVWAREVALAAASEYTSALSGGEVVRPSAAGGPWFVAGHQPELFHPGVWAKNFAVHELARRSGGVGLNLVIDNDLCASVRIRIPQGGNRSLHFGTLPFDADRPPQPWEEARVVAMDLFRSFGSRAEEAMRPWNILPLAVDIWPRAVAHAEATPRLGDCLAAARVQTERAWGAANLELPIRRVCELPPFLWFAAHLLAELPRLHAAYNRVVREYREVNRIRSRTHPVPELGERDGWLEAPFWVWCAGECVRRRLFARRVGAEVRLSDGTAELAVLQLAAETDACSAIERISELVQSGLRLRSRALTTTLFARLFLADLFVHGVGGAKYDEMTDGLMAELFGIAPPELAVFSATLHLPLGARCEASTEEVRRTEWLLRDLRFNPDRHLPAAPPASIAALLEEKRRLIQEQHAAEVARGRTRSRRRAQSRVNHARFRRLQEINAQLQAFMAERRQAAQSRLQALRAGLQANSVLQSREYAYCLFPEEKLRSFLADLWDRSA